MKRKIAISVGAGNHQLPLIRELQRRNFIVAAFDRDPEAPGAKLADFFAPISTWDVDAAGRWLDTIAGPFVGAFCFSYGKALTTQFELINRYELEGYIDFERANLSHDKYFQRQFLQRGGLTDINEFRLQNIPDFDKKFRYLVKDRSGGSSKGIKVFEKEELRLELALYPTSFDNSVAQPILEGNEYRVITLVKGGQIYFGTALRRYNLPGTFVCSHYFTLSQVPEALICLVEKLVRLLSQSTYFLKIDVMEVEWGMEIIEFDLGRPGDYFETLIAPYCFALDFTSLYVDVYLGQNLKPLPCWQPPEVHGTLRFLYNPETTINELQENTGAEYLAYQSTGQRACKGVPQSNQDATGILLQKGKIPISY
jgi:hypothetical protein